MKIESNTGLFWTQPVTARARHNEYIDGLSSPELSIVSSVTKFGNKLKNSIFPRNTRQHQTEEFLDSFPALNEIALKRVDCIVMAHGLPMRSLSLLIRDWYTIVTAVQDPVPSS